MVPPPNSALRVPPRAGHDDASLAALVRTGDDGAFETIVVRHRRGLVRHCARVLGEGDAEEAVQEALLKAHRALQAGEDVRQLGPWLRTIAHNTAVNMLRARAARMPVSELCCECAEPTEDFAEHRQQVHAVFQVLHGLPRRQRDAIVMRELEGRSYEEIGLRLGTSHGAVRQLLNRARTAVRERVGAVSVLEPLTRWLGSAGGGETARVGALSSGCAVTAKVCAAALLPALGAGVAASVGASTAPHVSRGSSGAGTVISLRASSAPASLSQGARATAAGVASGANAPSTGRSGAAQSASAGQVKPSGSQAAASGSKTFSGGLGGGRSHPGGTFPGGSNPAMNGPSGLGHHADWSTDGRGPASPAPAQMAQEHSTMSPEQPPQHAQPDGSGSTVSGPPPGSMPGGGGKSGGRMAGGGGMPGGRGGGMPRH